MKKNIKLYENHTIITKSWRKVILPIIPRVLIFALCLIVSLLYVPTGLLWLISMGHISLISGVDWIFKQLSNILFGDKMYKLHKIKLLVDEGLVTKSWFRNMTSFIFIMALIPLGVLWIITAVIWLLSLGHLHLYRLVNQVFNYMTQDKYFS